MSTAMPLRAIARAEFQRCWRVSVALLAIVLLYVGGLYFYGDYVREELSRRMPLRESGFDMIERSRATPKEVFLMPVLLLAAMLCGVIGAFEGVRGLALGLPSRYLTIPLRAGATVFAMFLCRAALLLPLTGVLWMVAHVLYLTDEYPMTAWLHGWVVGVAAPLAASVWRHRIGAWSLWLWLLLPTGLWFAGLFDYLLVGETPTLMAASALSLAGLLSSCGLLWRGAALEAYEAPAFSKVRLGGSASVLVFRNAAAALRWSVRPRFLFWVLPITTVCALPAAVYTISIELPMMRGLQWLPWTPTHVVAMAYTQAFLVRWCHFAFTLLPWVLGLAAAMEGIGFLRMNILRRPIHLRLPIATESIALHSCLVVLVEMTRVAFLGALLFGGLHALASGPNIGAQYARPEMSGTYAVTYLDSAYTYSWFASEAYNAKPQTAEYLLRAHEVYLAGDQPPGVFGILLGSRMGAFLTLASIGWMAFWQVLWVAVPICWETGLEGFVVVIVMLWFGWRRTRLGKLWQALACLGVALLFGLTYEHYFDWGLGRLEYAWIIQPSRALMGSLGLFLMPMATLWGATRLLRHG